MSHIDEAFIQAYAQPHQPANVPGVGEVPVATSPPASPVQQAGTHQPTPHIQFHQSPPPSPQSSAPAWAPEPVPAPHFQMRKKGVPGEGPTRSVTPPPDDVVSTTTVERPAERRPLSTFSAPEPPATTVFNPVFEVDEFRWPKITVDLLNAHHQLLLPVVEQLLEVSAQGRSLIGLAGTRPNVGCTTLLLSVSRLLTNAGKSGALVDANFSKASLGRDLGLDFDAGWENVLTGELPLAECVVRSLQDNMVLLPLTKPTSSAQELLASIQTSVTAGVLRYHYDLVLFNLGAAAQPPQHEAALSIMQHCRLDAGMIVADTTPTGNDSLDPLLALYGSTCLGVVGNSAC